MEALSLTSYRAAVRPITIQNLRYFFLILERAISGVIRWQKERNGELVHGYEQGLKQPEKMLSRNYVMVQELKVGSDSCAI
jgi:hypothetical protein